MRQPTKNRSRHRPTKDEKGAKDGQQPGWTIRRAAGVEILTVDALLQISWLVHGFSTRSGGESRIAQERVLNLGYTDWDVRAAVERNSRIVGVPSTKGSL